MDMIFRNPSFQKPALDDSHKIQIAFGGLLAAIKAREMAEELLAHLIAAFADRRPDRHAEIPGFRPASFLKNLEHLRDNPILHTFPSAMHDPRDLLDRIPEKNRYTKE